MASLVVAFFAAYVTLDLTGRVRSASGLARLLWWAGGALSLGTGIWAMHFVGMLGFSAGIDLGYAWGPTAVSWIAAVGVAALALGVAAREALTGRTLLAGSATIAAGICAMHYVGMGALDLAPGIVWRVPMVLLSVAIAWGASALALAIFFALRRHDGWQRIRWQAAASVVMGLAIWGMHYTGMAAVQLPIDAVCTSIDGLRGQPLAVLVALSALFILGGALLLSVSDALADAREARLARSLQQANADLRDANAELHRRAFEDALCGVPNRALFNDRLQHAIDRIGRLWVGETTPRPVKIERLAIMFVDLDGFKPINDFFGHAAGDEVLREVARRLRATVRQSDTLARLGGDEFATLVESVNAEADALRLGQRMIETLKRPFTIEGQHVSLSCSIGIVIFPDHERSGERLLACADAAMYAAKRAGGGTCVVYEPSMSGDGAQQVLMQQALRESLEHGNLMLYYQPKVDRLHGNVSGLEALLRWNHPKFGMVSPAVFIPLAERFGLIGALGNWVIDRACAQLASWHAQNLQCRVAINLSPHQLRQPDLADRIEQALERHGLSASSLVCEITESAMMENTREERGMLERIAALGVRLSIDDFGTGYSSLAHLRRIPARQLKIDRSFVVDITASHEARAVLDAIVRLAHALQMEVVAEGVETEDQQRSLEALGCDLLQGYHIARPMPADAVPGWMSARESVRRDGSATLSGLLGLPT